MCLFSNFRGHVDISVLHVMIEQEQATHIC
jgi:hypothetical protein